MPFNTAIFYDIENLLKGNGFSWKMASALSLREIVKAINRTGRVDQIAVQRAYANWSDPRLAVMRTEINELGIDPIQVFGFCREPKKNAADIQLAIDAIDLAHVRPALDVFVIVSGDGGFGALARKLHEYRITVIGCAYRNAANSNFQAVCDEFVWITDLEEEPRQDRGGLTGSGQQNLPNQRNIRLAKKIRKSTSLSPEDVLAKTREVLNWYASDVESRSELTRDGLGLSVVKEGVNLAIPGFQEISFGFAKFGEYLQYACKEMPLCVARVPNSQLALVLRGSVRDGIEVFPDLEAKDLHTADGYRALLATGSPFIRLPPPDELLPLVSWLAQNPPERSDPGSIAEAALVGLNSSVSSEATHLVLRSLVVAEAFDREPEAAPFAEQKLTLLGDVRTPANLLAVLRRAAQDKLVAMRVQVKDDVLQQLLGEIT